MRVALECFACFLEQILKTGRVIGAEEKVVLRLIRDFSQAIPRIDPIVTPAEVGGIAYRIINQVAGVTDPYRAAKRRSVEQALALLPRIKSRVESSEDQLLAAVKAAIAGNVIDFGVSAEFDLDDQFDRMLDLDLAVDHYAEFKRRLSEAKEIVYIADNAGESVFDGLLLETIGKPATYAVRESAIINDATVEDAVLSGIGRLARIMSSGCSLPGTVLSFCSERFKQALNAADLVISKGQGNYEGLSGERLPVFFLLKAKCEPVARELRVKVGDLVLMKSRNFFSGRQAKG
jgi:uncharacterized protein with ATP-grasp and redox domains